jgi:type IV pilus assembly protein PilC
MPMFQYTAHTLNGEKNEGTLTASTQAEATAQLRAKGLFPSKIIQLNSAHTKTEKTKPLAKKIQRPTLLASVSTKHLMIFTRQLSTLIQAGLPLLRALTVLERQEKHGALKRAQNGLIESIENGSTLADALALYPRIFNTLYLNMVRAGEAGGMLDVVLDRLAAYMEKGEKIKNKVLAAMTYPLVILIVSTTIVIFLMTHIIPKFESLFQDMLNGQALPDLTLAILNLSQTMATHRIALFILLALLLFLPKLIRLSAPGRRLHDWMKLYLSPLRSLTRLTLLARFARTLGTLLQSGVPILQALTIVKGTLNNQQMAAALQDIHDNIKEGESMTSPVEAHPLFPPVFSGMVEVGEETGQLPAMLTKIADMYEEEVDTTITALSALIEPLLIVLLSIIIGTIVIALFLPMTSLIGNLN